MVAYDVQCVTYGMLSTLNSRYKRHDRTFVQVYSKLVESRTCQQVRTGTQELRADAAVNSGNTLAAWAELLSAGEAVHMLTNAQQAYEAALSQEEDAAVRHLALINHAVYVTLQLLPLMPMLHECAAMRSRHKQHL